MATSSFPQPTVITAVGLWKVVSFTPLFYIVPFFKIISIANGKIKQFKYFKHTIPNSSILFVSDYLHIICSIINAYLVPSIKDIRTGKEMAIKMLNLLHSENVLQKRLSLSTNIRWKKYDAITCNFPILTIDDIHRYCFGMN